MELSALENSWFLAAALASAATLLIHFFLGGREIARPLLDASDIDPIAKPTNYYCWHLVTLTLAVMAAGFIWGGFDAGAKDVPAIMLALAITFAVWNVALIVWHGRSPLLMPQWVMFATISALGIAGFAA